MSKSSTPPAIDSGLTDSPQPAPESKQNLPAETQTPASTYPPLEGPAERGIASIGVEEAQGEASAKKSKSSSKKAMSDPQTLEQFIQYAYGRKGQRLVLKPKVERQISQSCHLDDETLGRLFELVESDTLLSVPRQILLVSQEVTGRPGLRAALSSFVLTVMLRHPAFGDAGVQAALRNLPEGLEVADALAEVAAFEPLSGGDTKPLKGPDLEDMRHNAVHLFVAWLAVNRGLSVEQLSVLLFQTVWQPAAQDLADDSSRLRALTDLGQFSGLGLACQYFHRQAMDARALQAQSQHDATILRDRLSAAEAQLTDTADQLEALGDELRALRKSSQAEMENWRRQHAVEKTHLQHELEQLRGRLVKRLTDSVEMLEVGLSALGKETPRITVMVERAEHVVDALRAEIQALEKE